MFKSTPFYPPIAIDKKARSGRKLC